MRLVLSDWSHLADVNVTSGAIAERASPGSFFSACAGSPLAALANFGLFEDVQDFGLFAGLKLVAFFSFYAFLLVLI